MTEKLWNQLAAAEKLALTSKWGRFLYKPVRYVWAFVFRKIVYPVTRKELFVVTRLFYGRPMYISLPASTDIYLTGAKSHHSEIRLAKFLLRNLNEEDMFVDIGAHYGYFSLLAAEITGKRGKLLSFEPSPSSFSLLKKNMADCPNANVSQRAMTSKEGELIFYEFPALYSEYNTINTKQFEDKPWFRQYKPKKHLLEATSIDKTLSSFKQEGKVVIKIDVEGAESDVIRGAINYLSANKVVLIMEYLEPRRKNQSHREAARLLKEMGYQSYLINNEGEAEPVRDIEVYLEAQQLDSDNIVFKKA